MKTRYFDKESARAYAAAEMALCDRNKRTVSIHDIALACGRENDPRWMTRIQNIIPDFVETLVGKNVKAVAVNAYCVRHYAEQPVTDPKLALGCVQLRGGGAPAAGIRRILDDGDYVYEAHLQSLMDLGCANVTGVLHNAKEAEARGLLPINRTKQFAAVVQNRIQAVAELPAPAIQQQLPESAA